MLEQIMGYEFQHPGLALAAITHASLPEAAGGCYQRLEFLGDAALDMLITEDAFRSYTCACCSCSCPNGRRQPPTPGAPPASWQPAGVRRASFLATLHMQRTDIAHG